MIFYPYLGILNSAEFFNDNMKLVSSNILN